MSSASNFFNSTKSINALAVIVLCWGWNPSSARATENDTGGKVAGQNETVEAKNATAAATGGKVAPSSQPKYNRRLPATWKLGAKLGPGSAARTQLIGELTAPASGTGEAALTEQEAQALLNDPRAAMIYADKTVSIVAPSSVKRQHQQHVDLLALFLKPERIAAAVQFATEHAAVLETAEKTHGVDRQVVVSILMWESNLGTLTGDYFAFNSFASQAYFAQEASAVALVKKSERKLIKPQKQAQRLAIISERAHRNLVVLLRHCKARGIDPLGVKGSWAGALGFPQFMPASLRWAEDGDGDGKIDLFTFDDSIASIARYLEAHGYATNPQQAVWAYNHEDAYVEGVLEFAKAVADQLGLTKPGADQSADAGQPDANAIP